MQELRTVGPYHVVAELYGAVSPDMRRCLGVSTEHPGSKALLEVSLDAYANDTSYGVRFQAEAHRSGRLSGPAAASFVSAGAVPRPWRAFRYVPAVPLPEAFALSGEALPADSVLRLGADVARTLALAHSNGIVHAGISPSSVLLGYGGPILMGFGAVRAAASEGLSTAGCPGVVESSLAPEQFSEGRPQPLADIYALGTLLAYAATGRVRARGSELPLSLRQAVARCTAADPEARPQAAALAAELVAEPAANWLPPPVTAAIRAQETSMRAAAKEAVLASGTVAPQAAPDSGRSVRSRRALLFGAAAGAAGAALGGMGAYALSPEGSPSGGGGKAAPQKGAAPEPLWSSELPFKAKEADMLRPPVVWEDRVAVYAAQRTLVGIDVEDGSRRWTANEVWSRGTLQLLEDGLILVPGRTLRALSAENGEVQWTASDHTRESGTEFFAPLGSSGTVFWFLARKKGGRRDREFTVVAYDVREREERWRTPIAAPAVGGFKKQGDLLLVPAREGSLTAISVSSGERLWKQSYPGASWGKGGPVATTVPGGLLAVTADEKLHVFESRTAEKRWTFEPGTARPFGAAVHRGGTLYVMDGSASVYALDVRTGRWEWQNRSRLEHQYNLRYPLVTMSSSGETVITSTTGTVDAYRSGSGELLWHFTSMGRTKDKGFSGVANAEAEGKILVHNSGVVHALPVD